MRVLVVEDEHRLARAVARGLRKQGFEVSLAHDGHTGYRLARNEDFDALVLDLMLPGMSGHAVCKQLRARGIWTPILVLTARDGEFDEADSLGLGADDYLRKPFSYVVLLARLNALLRRSVLDKPMEIVVGGLVLDPGKRTVRRGDTPIALTPREFSLLEFLMRSAGITRSKRDILENVWGADFVRDANVVEVYVGYLRRKVDEPFSTASLETVRGQGYRLGPG